jgi:Ubiquitin-activating enzyme E1 FCCH domain
VADIPVIVTAAGAQPTPPSVLNAQLIAAVTAVNPGYTILGAALIEDVASTNTGALTICDSARVETINSLTPFGANNFLLWQLGQIYIGPGSAPGTPTNTSVYVTFTAEDAASSAALSGYVIPVGFTVSDGTYQYIVQDGGVTASSGVTEPLFCIATIPGSWAVATNTVSQIVTSVPSTVTLSCTNPTPGVAAAAAETAEQYRVRVLQAGQAIATGTATMLKTLLGQVPGVQQRLVSTLQISGGGWTVIAGGGDPYLTAGAIYASGLDISTLVAPPLSVTNITQAASGEVTTATNHNLTTGESITMSGIVGMVNLNGVLVPVTVVDEKHFTIGVNTTGYPAYISGGTISPNPIVVTPNINDPPNIYGVPFVNPPAQTVTMTVQYNTTQPNFTGAAAVAQLAAPAIADYVNSIAAGNPINLLVVQNVFAAAIASILDPSLISALTISVSINGVSTAPVGELVESDPYSYFTATTAGITVEQA